MEASVTFSGWTSTCFLGFQRLVQAFGIAAAFHHAAGEFVDDDDLVVLDDIVLVPLEQQVRLQRLVDVMDHGDVLGVVEIAIGQQARRLEQLAHMLVALFGQRHLAGLFVQVVVFLFQRAHHRIDGAVHLGLVFGGTGNDQRRARLVDQDGVHFVDDGEGVAALGHGVQRVFHVVAQIVEAELVVGAVGDVGGIGGLALAVVQAMDDAAHAHAQETVDLAHPFAVALGQIVVDRHHMHAVAGQRIEIDGQGGDQGLAFAGLHLGDVALVQHHAAHQLHVEMALAQGALGRLAHHREGFRQQVVQGLALLPAGRGRPASWPPVRRPTWPGSGAPGH